AAELCSADMSAHIGLERRTLLLVRLGGNEALVRAAERAVAELGTVTLVDGAVWDRLRTAEPSGAAVIRLGTLPASPGSRRALEDVKGSPPGPVHLSHAHVKGTLAVEDPDERTHIDRYLGCGACETACPTGVRCGRLLEGRRATLTAKQPDAPVARAIRFTH